MIPSCPGMAMLPSVEAMMVVLPLLLGPWSSSRLQVITNVEPLTSMFTFFAIALFPLVAGDTLPDYFLLMVCFLGRSAANLMKTSKIHLNYN